MAEFRRGDRPLTQGEFRVRVLAGTFGVFVLLAAVVAMIVG